MRTAFLLFALLFLTPGAGATTIPVIRVEHSFATEGPLSVCNLPDGSGTPMSAVYGPGGGVVDGTLTMTLYDDTSGSGQPVANFPFEDLWIDGGDGGLAHCVGGACPDGNTDLKGETRWSQPLELGGSAGPEAGTGSLFIYVMGTVPEGEAQLADLSMNSPDLNGDRTVNLTDVHQFAVDYFGPYVYRSDFVRDGDVNLSDLTVLARAYGKTCP